MPKASRSSKTKKESGLDLPQIAELWRTAAWCARGCSTSPPARSHKDQELSAIDGLRLRFGRGTLDGTEAIDLDVPAPVITLSLLRRLRSRESTNRTRPPAVSVAESVRWARDQEELGRENGKKTGKRETGNGNKRRKLSVESLGAGTEPGAYDGDEGGTTRQTEGTTGA